MRRIDAIAVALATHALFGCAQAQPPPTAPSVVLAATPKAGAEGHRHVVVPSMAVALDVPLSARVSEHGASDKEESQYEYLYVHLPGVTPACLTISRFVREGRPGLEDPAKDAPKARRIVLGGQQGIEGEEESDEQGPVSFRALTIGSARYRFLVPKEAACQAVAEQMLGSVSFEPAWGPFAEPEGRYTVAVPELAARSRYVADDTPPSYAFVIGSRSYFGQCVHVETPLDAEVHERRVRGYLTSDGKELERITPIRDESGIGFDAWGTRPSGRVRVRSLRSPQAADLMCSVFVLDGEGRGSTDDDDAERFFQSFQVLP